MAAVEPMVIDRPKSLPMRALSWIDRWFAFRDRLLASARFRRWALMFPLTRPVARHRTRALFDLCGGFVYSQILYACVEVKLFDILAEGPQSGAALAPRLSLPSDAAARLIAAAVSLKLVSRRSGGRFGLGPLGAVMVDNDAVATMVRHHAILYRDLENPVALLRGEPLETGLSRYWAYARSTHPGRLSSDQVAGYTNLMAASQAMIGEEILAAYPISRHRRLLDVGGGDGTFLAAAAAHAPRLDLILFDLPSVAERARSRFAAMGITTRIKAVGGDFLSDRLPPGADLVSLVRVLHDHNDTAALALLRAIHRTLPSDGVLLIAEPMSETPGSEQVGDAYFGFYLLAMRSGRPRTQEQITGLLRKAGFTRSRSIRTRSPLLVRLLAARP